jgi:small subunit ribosomal protein S17
MVRIIECAPISKRKTWTVVARNGATLGDAAPDAVALLEAHHEPPAPAPHAV